MLKTCVTTTECKGKEFVLLLNEIGELILNILRLLQPHKYQGFQRLLFITNYTKNIINIMFGTSVTLVNTGVFRD